MTPEQARLLAAYNQWMNRKLYALCADMSAQELRQDRGAFFKSILGTLNHIMVGDKVWLGRFTGELFRPTGLNQILHEDFAELRQAREALDERTLQWAATLTPAALAAELKFVSILGPQPRVCKLWTAATHFFNHQAHHRGQLTTLLSQCGLDPGVTDLIAMPGLMRVEE